MWGSHPMISQFRSLLGHIYWLNPQFLCFVPRQIKSRSYPHPSSQKNMIKENKTLIPLNNKGKREDTECMYYLTASHVPYHRLSRNCMQITYKLLKNRFKRNLTLFTYFTNKIIFQRGNDVSSRPIQCNLDQRCDTLENNCLSFLIYINKNLENSHGNRY